MFARALVNEAECSDLNSCVAEPSALPMNSSQRHTRVRLADDTLYPVANETRRDLLGGWVECTRLADWRRCSPGARSLCAADNRTKEGGRKSGVGCEESAMLLGSVPAVLPLVSTTCNRALSRRRWGAVGVGLVGDGWPLWLVVWGQRPGWQAGTPEPELSPANQPSPDRCQPDENSAPLGESPAPILATYTRLDWSLARCAANPVGQRRRAGGPKRSNFAGCLCGPGRPGHVKRPSTRRATTASTICGGANCPLGLGLVGALGNRDGVARARGGNGWLVPDWRAHLSIFHANPPASLHPDGRSAGHSSPVCHGQKKSSVPRCRPLQAGSSARLPGPGQSGVLAPQKTA